MIAFITVLLVAGFLLAVFLLGHYGSRAAYWSLTRAVQRGGPVRGASDEDLRAWQRTITDLREVARSTRRPLPAWAQQRERDIAEELDTRELSAAAHQLWLQRPVVAHDTDSN